MQILFVAPFLFAAALAFTILAAIPPWRRWAIPIPTGIIAAAPCLFAVMGAELWVVHLLGRDTGPSPGRKVLLAGLAVAIVGGILGGSVAGVVARLLTGILPRLVLRSAIVLAAWCSYFVLFVVLNIAATARWRLPDNNALPFAEAALALIGAWFTATNPEPFRSPHFRLPVGIGFRHRGRQSLAGK
ncbi:MAG: hypothetical protein WBD06_22295 [Acidobacteriaceae bacterium]